MESEMSNAQEKENEQQQQLQQQQLPTDNPPAVPPPITPFTDLDMDQDKPPKPSPVTETQNPNPTLDCPESEDSKISAPHQSDKSTDEQQLPNNPPSPPPSPHHEVAETKLISVAKSQPPSASSSSDIDGGAPSVPKDQNAAAAAAPIPNKHVEEDAKTKLLETPPPANKSDDHSAAPKENNEPGPSTNARTSSIKVEAGNKSELDTPAAKNNDTSNSKYPFLLDNNNNDGNESGTEEEQSEFMKELENFFRERSMDFKPPKFYGEQLNCLKLWRSVMRLGGYDKVTSCKWWRQVGESFKPPKTCTTVSWTFRGFYEKALLDYERHKTHGSDFKVPVVSTPKPVNVDNQASGSGRTVRESAQRAMINWHSERVLDNGEVSEAIIKDKNSVSSQKREKQGKSSSLPKRRRPSEEDNPVKAARTKESKLQLDVEVVDIGPPADWVKINVQKTKDSFEVYALVPGLLREEVRVQSDPAGRLVISGEPEHPDNPWGVKPFRKVVTLPSRIDPHQTSAVVTLHGQLFVRVPFQQSDQ